MSASDTPVGGVSPQPEEKPPKHPVEQCCDKIFESFKDSDYCGTLAKYEELQSHDLEDYCAASAAQNKSVIVAWGRALQAAWKMSGDEEHMQEMLEDFEGRFGGLPQYLSALLADGDNIVEALQTFAAHNPPPIAGEVVEALLDKYKSSSKEDIAALVELMKSLSIPIEGEASEKLQRSFVFRMRAEDPEDVLDEMIALGVKPTGPHAYNFIFLKPTIKAAGKTILDYYYEMLDNGIKPAESTFRILGKKATVSREDGAMFRRRLKGETGVEERYMNWLRNCTSKNNEEEAGRIYRRMMMEGIHPDKYVFNHIILTCRREPERAEHWYQEMLKQGVAPNAVTFTNLITVFKDSKTVDAADKWIDEMRNQGVELDQHNYSAMLDSYVKAGQRGKAMHCFKNMLERGDCSISGYNYVIRLGPFDFALGCLACMMAEGLQPTSATRSAMHHMGRDQISLELLEELTACGWSKDDILRSDALVSPPKGTYPSIVDCMRLMFREIKLEDDVIKRRTEMLNNEIALSRK